MHWTKKRLRLMGTLFVEHTDNSLVLYKIGVEKKGLVNLKLMFIN